MTADALASAGGQADGRELPPIAGRFEITGGHLYFIPRFPLAGGMDYTLLVQRAASHGRERLAQSWQIHRPATGGEPSAFVEAIYPDVAQVPVNLLKIYVRFSEPMSEGRAERAISVRREDTGEALDGVFVPMDPELWDPERRRLTLLLDPARIKHGLVPNLEAGYPLIEGVPFRLTIGTNLRDAQGLPLKNPAERVYNVGPEISSLIRPAQWRLNVPAAGSLDPLAVEFDRPLDYALLQRCLGVTGPEGTSLPGAARSGPQESSWAFVPEFPWAAGPHRLTVERRLEDLAGNSPVRVFDRDMTLPQEQAPPAGPLSVEFLCDG